MSIESINVRRVGKGFIVGRSEIKNKGTKDEQWSNKEDIFLDKDKLTEHVKEQIGKL